MSGFIAFAKKEIMHIKRDPIIIFFCLVLPCIQLLLLGFAIDFDVRHVSTAVVDQSHSRESRELLDKLHNTQYLDITSYNLSRHEALRRLDKSECKIVIVIPPDLKPRPWWTAQMPRSLSAWSLLCAISTLLTRPKPPYATGSSLRLMLVFSTTQPLKLIFSCCLVLLVLFCRLLPSC